MFFPVVNSEFGVLFPDLLHNVQAVQTDSMTEELGVNTEADWESQVEKMLEYSSSLTEQYDSLMKRQGEEEVSHEKRVQQLQKKKEETTRQHQVRPTQTHSLRRHRGAALVNCDCVFRLS